MKTFDDIMAEATKKMEGFCDMLVDVINIENGVQDKPTTSVKGWTKDGNLLLTKIEVEDGHKLSVDTIVSNKKCVEYINKQLGYEVKLTPYTYSDGYKGKAVVLN